MEWLEYTVKEQEFCVLNYMVTCNHIHLLIKDTQGSNEAIAGCMQLIEGRTAQEYNFLNKRSGAFWGDRYHATMIDSHSHLLRCMTYIDLNMVRAGVVKDPGEWIWCGYNELQDNQENRRIVSTTMLMNLLGMSQKDDFKTYRREAVAHALDEKTMAARDPRWSESIALGRSSFVLEVKNQLGSKARNAAMQEDSGADCVLKEPRGGYSPELSPSIDLDSEEESWFLKGDNTVEFS